VIISTHRWRRGSDSGMYPFSWVAGGACLDEEQNSLYSDLKSQPHQPVRRAFKMEASVPQLMDLKDEPQSHSSTCTAARSSRRQLRRETALGAADGGAKVIRFIQLLPPGTGTITTN